MGRVIARRNLCVEPTGSLGKVIQRKPSVRRKTVSDVAGGIKRAVDVVQQAFRHGIVHFHIQRFEITRHMRKQGLTWVGGFGITSVPGAQDAQCAFRTFDIAAEPEEIVRRTAWQAARHIAGEASFLPPVKAWCVPPACR